MNLIGIHFNYGFIFTFLFFLSTQLSKINSHRG